MINAKCVQKFRDKHGKIVGYRIIDNTETTIDIDANKLKKKIRNKEISISNLTLTSDNRLISTNEKLEINVNNKNTKMCNEHIQRLNYYLALANLIDIHDILNNPNEFEVDAYAGEWKEPINRLGLDRYDSEEEHMGYKVHFTIYDIKDGDTKEGNVIVEILCQKPLIGNSSSIEYMKILDRKECITGDLKADADNINKRIKEYLNDKQRKQRDEKAFNWKRFMGITK